MQYRNASEHCLSVGVAGRLTLRAHKVRVAVVHPAPGQVLHVKHIGIIQRLALCIEAAIQEQLARLQLCHDAVAAGAGHIPAVCRRHQAAQAARGLHLHEHQLVQQHRLLLSIDAPAAKHDNGACGGSCGGTLTGCWHVAVQQGLHPVGHLVSNMKAVFARGANWELAPTSHEVWVCRTQLTQTSVPCDSRKLATDERHLTVVPGSAS